MEKIKITIDGNDYEAINRTFSSGRKGYGLYGKITINGKVHQMSCNIVQL